MDIYEIGDLAAEARRYGLKCITERVGKGENDEYTICFGRGLLFKDGRAASKFIEAVVKEHNLSDIGKPYRTAFGWEIF